MKSEAARLSCLALFAGVLLVILGVQGCSSSENNVDNTGESTATRNRSETESYTGDETATYEHFVQVTSSNITEVGNAVAVIDHSWPQGSEIMLIEASRFCEAMPAMMHIYELLRKKTAQPIQLDINRWYHWIWEQDYNPHPDYGKFKSALYSKIDPLFAEYFVETEDAKIRLDEIRWGGVKRDGIPPLKDPEMIPAEEASYLDDSNVVFGVVMNGDARCYPKRILAWHEMFKDSIGGIPVCGVY